MERSIGWLKSESQSDDERRHALAHELGVPFVELDPHSLSLEALSLIPEPLARHHSAVAYALEGRSLQVALLSLDDLAHLEFLRSRYRLLPRLTTRHSLVQALLRYQRHLREGYGKRLEQASARSDASLMVDTLVRHALVSGATDVHLQQGDEGLLVRYRVHGALRDAMSLPVAAGAALLGALRSLSGLAPSGLPRETRVKVELDQERLSLRIASLPTASGEKMTVHVTRGEARRGYTLESLGLHGEALERVHEVLSARRGLITVSGTGKTTLLYTMLDLLNAPELSIATVETAIEHELRRVAQTQVAPEAGLGMASALRAALRQDADVVMLDTVTDAETAQLAAAAAKRGALVLAALDSPERLPQADLRITSALVRKLCAKHLADKLKLSRAQGDELEIKGADFAKVLAALKDEGRVPKDTGWKDVRFTRPTACSECKEGYRGLIGIQEVAGGGGAGLTLIEDGLCKAVQGLTSIDEISIF